MHLLLCENSTLGATLCLKKEHHGFSNPFLKMKIFQNVYYSKTISSSVKLIFKLWKNVSGQLTLECQLFQIR